MHISTPATLRVLFFIQFFVVLLHRQTKKSFRKDKKKTDCLTTKI